jgi:hypothetical protein
LNPDGTTNNVMIGSVVIQPIESGKFLTAAGVEIESVTGGNVDDCETKKLNQAAVGLRNRALQLS